MSPREAFPSPHEALLNPGCWLSAWSIPRKVDYDFAAPMVLTICGSRATLWEVSIGFWGTEQQDLPCAQSMLGTVTEGWAGGSGQVRGEKISVERV